MRAHDRSDGVSVRAYEVTGRVQGVGFRWWTRERARELGLVGDVRNRPDGSVLVRAAGPPAALDRLERVLAEGPAAARVGAVERVSGASEIAERTSFEIER